jgi:type II secretory pathway component HofQ
VLGDIPWIGKTFFTQERTVNERGYLLIFIKAKIKETQKGV